MKNWKIAGEVDGQRVFELKRAIVPHVLPQIVDGSVSLADAIMALVEMQHDLLTWAEGHNPSFLLKRVPVDPETGKVIEE